MGRFAVLLLLTATSHYVVDAGVKILGELQTGTRTLAAGEATLKGPAIVKYNSEHTYNITIDRVQITHNADADIAITAGGLDKPEIEIEITPKNLNTADGMITDIVLHGHFAPGKEPTDGSLEQPQALQFQPKE